MQNALMFDWGDLRYFLAVARGGSTLAAAKILGVNQTTVARRVAVLEEALGEKLFERAAGGYRLTEVGTAMVQNAERVELEVQAFARMVQQRSRRLSGVIRFTTNDVLADALLNPWLGEFNRRFPVVKLETIVTDQRLDLTRGEADIALRAGASPVVGDNLVVRKLGSGKWGIYASKAYVARAGKPAGPDELVNHSLIGGAGGLQDFEPEFFKKAKAGGAVVQSSYSSVLNIAHAVRAGLGVGPIPCVLGGLDPTFELCFMFDDHDYDLKLIIREELRSLPHVKAFSDFIAARTSALRHIIEGRAQ
jgi:DNA-binding transcriptional LysR family regulator